jgi:hypothetical protein
MMADYILSCCSTADLNVEHFENRDIHYICFHYSLDGRQLPDDLGQSMPFEEFYRRMAAGADTSTSQVNADEFEAYFTRFLQEGKDILHVTLSSGISGVINSAVIAKENLEAKFPDRKSTLWIRWRVQGYGLLMDKLADLRDSAWASTTCAPGPRPTSWNCITGFSPPTSVFTSKAAASPKPRGCSASAHICPLLNMDAQGRLVPRSKVRTKHKVIGKLWTG